MPVKDLVQETVSPLKSYQSHKTTIGEDVEICIPIWRTGTREAFLIHVSTALDAIKKQGTFKAYKEAAEAYVEQREAVKQTKAALALLMAPASKGKKLPRNLLQKLLRRLQTMTRKAQLWLQPSYQPQNCMQSIRLTTRKPSPLKLLLPRCFSSM